MIRLRRTLFITLAVLSIGAVGVYQAADRLLFDRYAGQARVIGLPAGFDPYAGTEPYHGPHPSLGDPAPDPYAYPIPIAGTGPVQPTSGGALEYPYACRSVAAGLGQPLVDNDEGAGVVVYVEDDAGHPGAVVAGYSKDCSLPTRVVYYALAKDSGEFKPYAGDPAGVAQVTVDDRAVPFVVRIEIGTINRHIYVIAMLRGPGDTPGDPDTSLWNGKLIYQFRGGVGIGRRQGRIEAAYIPDRRRHELARGFAVAYSTANQTANHYDIGLAADTVARVKRQFAARYGQPRHTIGIGKSGGAIQQYLIGQNRPELLDAGIAQAAYPDMITQTTEIMDCELLEYFFDVTDADNARWQTWSNRSLIEGFNAVDGVANNFERLEALKSLARGRWPTPSGGHTECTRSWRTLLPQIANPRYTYFASLFAPDVVAAVPWTYWDNLKAVFGTNEQGYARRTWDNAGVQYGLTALRGGQITVEEFLKLNFEIGGWKPAAEMAPERYWRFAGGHSDLNQVSIWSHHNRNERLSPDRPAPRSRGDEAAIAAAYRSGQVFIGRLSMPIIDVRHYLEPELDMHHALQSVSARLRMLRGQGHADNQLIWMARPPADPTAEALDLLERWLDAMAAGDGAEPAAARPSDATDRCYDDAGRVLASGDNVWDGVWNGKTDGACMQRYPVFANPRIVAGDDYSSHVFKCHRQSVDEAIARGVYAPVDMSRWRDRLLQVFPDGVCNYSRGEAAWPADLDAMKFSPNP